MLVPPPEMPFLLSRVSKCDPVKLPGGTSSDELGSQNPASGPSFCDVVSCLRTSGTFTRNMVVTAHLVTQKGVCGHKTTPVTVHNPEGMFAMAMIRKCQPQRPCGSSAREGRWHRPTTGTLAGSGIKESAERRMEDGAIPDKQNSQCPKF